MDVVELDDRAAEAAAREADFHRAAVEIRRLRLDLFVALDARFLLCRARLCAAPQPLELIPEEILPLCLARLLALDARGLLLEKVGVITRIRVGVPLVELENLRRRAVEEVAVMRDHEQCALAARKIRLEPCNRLAVEMIRRLIQEQQVAGLHERRRKRKALLLAARKRANWRGKVRDAELRQHRLRLALELPALRRVDGGRALREHLLHVSVVRPLLRCPQGELIVAQRLHERRRAAEDFHEHGVLGRKDLVLREHLHAQAAPLDARAIIDGRQPCDSFEERALSRAIHADDADALAVIDAEIDAREQRLFAIAFREVFQGQKHEDFLSL